MWPVIPASAHKGRKKNEIKIRMFPIAPPKDKMKMTCRKERTSSKGQSALGEIQRNFERRAAQPHLRVASNPEPESQAVASQPNGGYAHYNMVSKIQWKAILACHPALSTKWLDWVAKWCELWRMPTGPIRHHKMISSFRKKVSYLQVLHMIWMGICWHKLAWKSGLEVIVLTTPQD